MEGKCSSNELQRLIGAIESSDVVESRVKLFNEVRDLDLSEKFDVAYLIESLNTFWEHFTCLDVSQCMLNRSILSVAAKYVDSDLSECFLQFLLLGTKASIWCGKHLNMTCTSKEESQEEEHSIFFFQLLSDFLKFSANSFSALMRYPVSNSEVSMAAVEKFIVEQLNLTKDAVSENRIINTVGVDILKIAQAVIDAVIRLCKEYSQSVSSDSYDAGYAKDKNGVSCMPPMIMNHLANITKFTIEKLSELGILAANGGGNLVTVLNVSWKGVVILLQLGKGALAVKVNAADIIVTLISLVNESLQCTAEAWSSPLKEAISVNEARRTFLPVKFYVINAVKIATLFPTQAYLVYKEITLCLLIISSLRILLSHDKVLKLASEVLTELLERSSLDLLNSLLNSASVKLGHKFEILDWLFTEKCNLNPIYRNGGSYCRKSLTEEIFSLSLEAVPEAKVLLPGRVALFCSFLMYSSDLEEDMKVSITRKLGWVLNVLVNEEVYSSILVSEVPVLYDSGEMVELVWEPLFSSLLHSLKTFMVVLSSCHAWEEMISFLLENLFHPHLLCWEIVMELWCFLVFHAEVDLVNVIFDKLCALMKSLVSSESVLVPGSTLRKLARSICLLLTYSSQSMVDKVYNFAVDDDRSQSSSIMYLGLLLEEFPINSLSDNVRSLAKQKIIADYFSFFERFDDQSLIDSGSGSYGVAVFALSASLQSLQVTISDIETKTLKLLVAIIHRYRNLADKVMKAHYLKLLNESLRIISNMKHLYASDEIDEVLFELQDLFISGSAVSDTQLYQCKADVALFMAGFGHVEMPETDDCARSCAVWKLYKMLLRERHWALIHLALSAFGYFSERTTCNQLWKFVPHDAALSYELVTGNEPNEERFMLEFKAFLEKRPALLMFMPNSEQFELLVKEGLMLRDVSQNISNAELEPMGSESMEIVSVNQNNRRRKLPDGINKGMELLQGGLKVMGDGILQWQQNQFDSTELQDKFLTHFSCLQDLISHLVSLTDSR